MSLTRYQAKRDFSRTTEPAGATSRRRSSATGRILFVVQKHAARRLHYDFRLEMDRVLKSWAVPKGFPMSKGEKRLAMQVEDHPREYGNFEGIIPPGNYGAGTVMLWDAGICEVLESKPRDALRQGKLVLQLEGQKLHGHWTLVRIKPGEGREENAWLMIKTGEAAVPISKRSDDRSIVSGQTMEQIAAHPDRTWQSDRKQKTTRRAAVPVSRPKGRRASQPRRD